MTSIESFSRYFIFLSICCLIATVTKMSDHVKPVYTLFVSSDGVCFRNEGAGHAYLWNLRNKSEASSGRYSLNTAWNVFLNLTIAVQYHVAWWRSGLGSGTCDQEVVVSTPGLATTLDKLFTSLCPVTKQYNLLPVSCIHVLLPPPRDPNLLSRLRNPRMYPAACNRTKKFQSFVNYGLLHYQ